MNTSVAPKQAPLGFHLKARSGEKARKISLTFRDELVPALEKAKGKLEATWKVLDIIVAKPEYRRLAEPLLDVLYTGGLLAGEDRKTKIDCPSSGATYCVLKARESLNALRVYEQLFLRLMRRHKQVESAFTSHAARLLAELKTFDPQARRQLARIFTLFIINGTLNARVLLALGQQHYIDEGLTLEFLLEVFATLKREKGAAFLVQTVKRAGLENRILSFMPPPMRSDLHFHQVYQERDLSEIIKLHQVRTGQELGRQLRLRLLDDFNEQVPHFDVVRGVRKFQAENNMSDSEIIGIVLSTIFSQGELPVRDHPLTEQDIRHVQPYNALLNALCNTERTQIVLLLRLQEYCYENPSFLKSFEKLVQQFFKSGVLNRDAIMRWYQTDHLDKGKVTFLGQMHRFIQTLKADANDSNKLRRGLMRPKVYSDVAPNNRK
ncbi:protein krasavietz-like [Scaptodrosophila lebanonensis]|uniref:Protein krasavietz-like n=1 Tax=Drosophila lebanonensis TaxID=7225 RepID=A0A6J2U1Z4_DROLE|nr:protein krasavietz-like [Scaptodrosophila lebanonensis]